MWYKLVDVKSKNYLLCFDGDVVLWKKEIPISFDAFLKGVSEEEKHNILIGTIDNALFERIPLKGNNKEGIEAFHDTLKISKTFTNCQKIAICAQSLLESNFGKSHLAINANNYCGIMYRDIFDNVAGLSKIRYTSPSDGIDTYYLKCSTPSHFLTAYFMFIQRSIYEGWEEKKTALEYIKHLKSCGYAADPEYINKVSSLFDEAEKILGIKEDEKPIPPSDEMPKIDITEYDSPNWSERGATISKIVVHNTASSFSSALSWLCNPQAQASCHLIIGRDGRVACIVPFSKKSWHAGPANSSSIGIEIEATNNQRGLTKIQEEVLVNWLKWLMKKYNIKNSGVITHRTVMNTDCPIFVWSNEVIFLDWKNKHL